MSSKSPQTGRCCHVCNGTGTIGGHWHAVLESVRHVDGKVTLHREDISFATGVGLRRAQQLMDEWATEKTAVELQEYEPATAVNGYEAQKKSICVDVQSALYTTETDRSGRTE